MDVFVNKASNGTVVLKLIEVGGGQELLMEKCNPGRSRLHDVCVNKASDGINLRLIDIGEQEIVMMED